MKSWNIIAAIDLDNCIGSDGKIPWHLSFDMKRFKAITMGHAVVMGRKTFDSLGNKPLKGRMNIVMTRDDTYSHEGIVVVHSKEELINLVLDEEFIEDEIFIIGGSEIYNQFIDYVDKIYLTRVRTRAEHPDAFFPDIDTARYSIVNRFSVPCDDCNEYAADYETWEHESMFEK